jgi:TolB-like protein/DNA-binding winged helix-turn-helix (wHTH) protein/tetratricopeptide (TPR) repeat protein
VKQVAPSHEVVRFSAFEVDFRKGEVCKHGFRIRLQDQPFHILQILLERPGELITREELQRQIWPADTFVDFEKGLNNAIKKLRDALGDSAEQPRFIETHSRRGYRFIGSVTATNGAGQKEDAASAGEVGAPARSRALYRRLVIGGVLFLAFVATLFGFDIGGVRERWLTRASSPAIHSLAVIPLANLSNDPNQEYFSDGMTDALITDLAQIGSLKVISRTSSMQYKQTKKSLSEIARELNVDGIVEGTVQRAGDHVRISAQLIHATSDKHLWAKSYEGDMRDVFALERDVTEDIARQVQAKLITPSQTAVAQFRPVNPRALDLYLQGNYHLNRFAKGTGDEEKRKAAEYFQQAIDADSNFAPAYNGLANAHHNLMWASSQDVEIVRKSAEQAVELDPAFSDAWVTLGELRLCSWDFRAAEDRFRRAVALNPNNANAHENLGDFLNYMGRLDEGLREGQIAQALDPNQDHLTFALFFRRDYDRGIARLLMMLKADPDNAYFHFMLFFSYAAKGMHKEAIDELEAGLRLFGFSESATKIHHAFAVSGYRGAMQQYAEELEHLTATKQLFIPVNLAEAYAALGEKDRAFYWLEQAYTHRDIVAAATGFGLEMIDVDPMMDPLRSDPRFKDLLRRIGLPELQVNESRASGQQNDHN